MKIKLAYLYIFILLLFTHSLKAQDSVKSLEDWVALTSSDFVSPLNIPLELAGNFGECRPNHFHTGLDLKTEQKENLPVFAVADGFVSRISMSHSGYGHCLYIQHPNGLTSVYAHLNTFNKEIQDYLERHQRQEEKWNVNILLEEDELIIKQGEQVALSGNTGGSMAPHLHFEIRESYSDYALNPAAFPAFKVKDNIAPALRQLGLYDAERSLYKQNPQLFNVQSTQKDHYKIADIKSPYQKIFLGLQVEDYMNNSSNWLGIYHAKIYVDNNLHFEIKMNKINLLINRMMNSYIDYGYYRKSRKTMQLFYITPNNQLDIFPSHHDNGMIVLQNDKTKIKIEIEDIFKNKSTLDFNIIHDGNHQNVTQNYEYEIIPQQYQNFNFDYFKLSTNALSVYDTVPLVYQTEKLDNAYSAFISINNQNTPIHDWTALAIRLTQPVPMDLRSKLIIVHGVKGSHLPGQASQNAMPAEFHQGFAIAKIRTFGDYHVGIDTIPPKVTMKSNPILHAEQSLIFEVKEDLTHLDYFAAYLEDETWINMRRYKNNFIATIPKEWDKGNKSLKVIVRDASQNESISNFNIEIK